MEWEQRGQEPEDERLTEPFPEGGFQAARPEDGGRRREMKQEWHGDAIVQGAEVRHWEAPAAPAEAKSWSVYAKKEEGVPEPEGRDEPPPLPIRHKEELTEACRPKVELPVYEGVGRKEMVKVKNTEEIPPEDDVGDADADGICRQKDWYADLPPSWKAFWATAPHLDVQTAYEQHKKRQLKGDAPKKQVSNVAELKVLLPQSIPGEDPKDEVVRLEEALRRRQEVLADRKRKYAECEQKLMRVKTLDQDEEEHVRKLGRMVDKASYAHGVVQGKIRSSDVYYQYLFEDAKGIQYKKVQTLTRAKNLMVRKLDEMKGDIREMLKVAAETLPPPPAVDSSLTPSRKALTTSEEEEESMSEAERVPPSPLPTRP